MYECVLVPLDGSKAGAAALSMAELIPSRSVRLVRVVPELGLLDWPPGDPEGLKRWKAEHEAEADRALDQAGAPLRQQGRAVETIVVHGDPADRIVEVAGDVDLIIMTSRGHGGGRRLLYGSVADRVARHARCSTLIVRGGERPVVAPPVTRIVVPLDGSALAEQALPFAADLALGLGLPLHLVRVVDLDLVRASVQAGPIAAAAYERSSTALTRQAEAYLDAQVKWLRDRDLASTSELRSGIPAGELLAAVNEGDLVVITPHGRGGIRRWLLGSVAEKLVRLAPAPVLLVRAGEDGS